jgi:alpha-beta hydrolase superfamily lysophospholipase
MQADLDVHALDLRGHGQSSGQRGHIENFKFLLDDVTHFQRHIERMYADIPMFIYGHSLGGTIVCSYILERNIDRLHGAIISSPWFRLAFSPPKIKLLLAGIMRFIYPVFSEKSNLDVHGLSRDPMVAKAYLSDPLVHDRITASAYYEISKQGEYLTKEVKPLNLPVLLSHGDADPVTSIQASREFVQQCKGDVEFKCWNGLRHEPHNEPEKDAVLDYYVSWMEDHYLNK